MQITQLDEPLVLETLRQVVDPEIDCNIVDLGLIYGTCIEGRKVTVKMTLTTPGCPMHESIAGGVKNALRKLEAVEEAEVEVVWEPPWSPSMMTDYGRARVGLRD